MLTQILLIVTLVFTCSTARDPFDLTGEVFSDFSVVIPRRGEECFYQPVDDEVESMYVQYTALREDILDELQFIVRGPAGQPLKQTSGESDSFDLDFTDDQHPGRGTYSICLYNNYIMKDVIVYLELEVWNENSLADDYEDDDETAEEALDSVSVLYQENYNDVHLTISGPDGAVLLHANGDYEEYRINITDSQQRGPYEMCFENRYLLEETAVYVEMWVEYNDSLDILLHSDNRDKLGNVTTSLKKIADRVQRMDLHAGLISQWYHKDSLTLRFSDKHVNNVGMLICVMIIGSGLLQAFFIKKLFLRAQEESNTDPPVISDQPRKSSNSRLA
ncbi:Hypp5596 [Branchiostoma lanceolatum]|uniref:Hypp5596 protein n=1 Tax=Branchiostoma lanceolatum TaxID=7740 RepID=A0A8J9YQJ1_BRALA|nr:Hypp5596 [Branchiostoma lanceolatum]